MLPQRLGNQPPVPGRWRACRRASVILALLGCSAVSAYMVRRLPPSSEVDAVVSRGVCHPNLARLRSPDGSHELLLIGTVPLDLDGESGKLVDSALRALSPDVIMVEGNYMVGVFAMFAAGNWEFHGMQKLPPAGDTNWTDIAAYAQHMELKFERPKGLRSIFGNQQAAFPSHSLVPGKVGKWARYLVSSIGADVKVAVATAMSTGVPIHFLGDQTDGLQGHFQVTMIANQAASELLQEEQQQGAEMPGPDVDAALRRAEGRVREDASNWLKDARNEYARTVQTLQQKMPPQVLETWREKTEDHAHNMASRICGTMDTYRKAAVVIPVDQLVRIERKLKEEGYEYVSSCA